MKRIISTMLRASSALVTCGTMMPVASHLERLHVVAVAALADAHDGVHVVQLGGADLVLEIEPVIRHMLVAQPDGGGAGEPGQLDDARIDEVELERAGILPARSSRRMRLERSFMEWWCIAYEKSGMQMSGTALLAAADAGDDDGHEFDGFLERQRARARAQHVDEGDELGAEGVVGVA